MKLTVFGRVALALSLVLPPMQVFAQDKFIFRYHQVMVSAGGESTPDPEEPSVEDPADEMPAFYRVVVESFHGPGSVAEVAFVKGTTAIRPTEASISGISSAEAFDLDPQTGWTGEDGGADIVYGVPVNSVPDALELTALDIDGPASFYIETSPNGQAWTPVISYTGEPEWAPGEKRRYPFSIAHTGEVGSAHKFWRVAVEKFNYNGSYNAIDEIVFRNASGADVTVGGQGYSDDQRGYTPLYVFDKKSNSGWTGQYMANYPASFWYEFPSPQSVASVDIRADAVWGAPQRFRIESSDDARTWTVRAFYVGQGGWVRGEYETRNFPVPNLPRPKDHHQYWRVRILAGSGTDKATLNDLRFLGEGGVDLHPRSVPFASSSVSGANSADWAYDGRNSNAWVAAEGDPEPWIGFIFPQPVKAETASVWSNYRTGPRAFTIDWSDDGITWATTAAHMGNGNWGVYEKRDFPVHPQAYPEGHYRFWRVAVDKTDTPTGTYVSVREMDFRSQDGSTFVGKGVPISGTFASYGKEPEQAFDGISNSGYNDFWQSAGLPDWVGYEFPKPVRPEGVSIIANGLNSPKDFRVQYSADGNAWTTTAEYRGQGTWQADERVFPVFGTADQGEGHQYWRIMVHANNGNRDVRVRRLAFYASSLEDRHVKGDPIEAGTSYTSYSADKAFDQDTAGLNNYWEGRWTGSDPVYIGYAFTRKVHVDEVHVMADTPTTAVRDFDIQWSDDEINWTTAESYRSSAGWKDSETRVFPIPKPVPAAGEAYSYMISFWNACTNSDTTKAKVNSVTLLKDITGYASTLSSDPQGTVVPMTGVATSLENEGDTTVLNAFDDRTYTLWETVSDDMDVGVRLDFALPVRIENFTFDFQPSCAAPVRQADLYMLRNGDWEHVAGRYWVLPVESE